MRRLRKGEYDLVNISLIGHDPVTGRSYDECQDEWDRERKRVLTEWERLRWWQWIRNLRCRWQIAVLVQRLGMPV